jgi:hypothetical protein
VLVNTVMNLDTVKDVSFIDQLSDYLLPHRALSMELAGIVTDIVP